MNKNLEKFYEDAFGGIINTSITWLILMFVLLAMFSK